MIRVIGFDNKEHLFNFTKNLNRKHNKHKSSFHQKARSVIKELFPRSSVYEEITLPGSKKIGRSNVLYADFFIPDAMLMVEVHGKQHYEFCSHFHKSPMDFVKSKKRDADKIEWCEINNIKIVILPYNQEKEWKNLIQMTMNQ